MIVVDSSAVVDYLVASLRGAWVEERLLEDPDLHAPHLLDVEVLGALRTIVEHRRQVVGRRAAELVGRLADLDVARYPHAPFIPRIWELRRSLTTYDAAYVALAEALDATLVTTDGRLARARGHRAHIVAP